MLIDYIYLILILILIGSILFFIYLSYEYRTNNKEGFINPQLDNLPQLNPQIPKNINSFLNPILEYRSHIISAVFIVLFLDI